MSYEVNIKVETHINEDIMELGAWLESEMGWALKRRFNPHGNNYEPDVKSLEISFTNILLQTEEAF